MRPLGGVKVCMAAYGEKGLSLFLRPEKTQGFFEIYQHTCIVAVHNICVLKKIVRGEKSYEVLNFFAWRLMGKKWLNLFFRLEKTREFFKNILSYLHCCCPQYMRI